MSVGGFLMFLIIPDTNPINAIVPKKRHHAMKIVVLTAIVDKGFFR